jgi:uncharacterized SAM-binding protein YcdF (DUF218 family)
MSRIAAVVKHMIPGSLMFLIAGLAIGVVLLNSGPLTMQVARAWLTSLLALYWLLSLPVVATVLIESLRHEYDTIRTLSEAAGAKVLVVIGNGSVHYRSGELTIDQLTRRSAFCVFEAARLYRLIQPDWVIASGGVAGADARARSESELMCNQLLEFHVSPDRLLLDSTSRTTEAQVVNVARLLEQHGIDGPIVAVTTAAHMPRVMKLFRDEHIDAVASVPAGLRYDDGCTGWRRWYPTAAALRGSESVIYEYLARIYTAGRSAKRLPAPRR